MASSEHDGELRPAVLAALEGEVEAVGQEDFLHHGQADSLTVAARGVEGSEELRLDLRREARPGVPYGEKMAASPLPPA